MPLKVNKLEKTNKIKLLFFLSTVVWLLFAAIGINSIIAGRFAVKKGEVRIVLTEKGFSPAGVKVEEGTKVIFVNKTKTDFWPASDLHPTHTIYSDFDSKAPVASGQTWEFVFSRVGTWRYHDHLNPKYRGTVQVLTGDEYSITFGSLGGSFEKCSNLDGKEEKIHCWSSYFDGVVLEKGIEKGFEEIQKRRNENEDFAAYCHTIVHTVGEVSYWVYANDGKLPKTGKIATCGYGFHHGFMQEFGHHSLNFLDEGKKMCDHLANLDYDGQEKSVEPYDQCYHGLGHGIAFYFLPSIGDNMRELIAKGNEACKEVPGIEGARVSNCIYGLFGALNAIYTGAHGYKLDMDKSDPFNFCKDQPEELKSPCYDSLVPAAWVLTENDPLETASYLKGLKDQDFLVQALYNFGDIISPKVITGDLSSRDAIKVCHSFMGELRDQCLKGLSQGIIRNGSPNSVLGLASDICSLLEGEEKSNCLEHVFSEAKINLPMTSIKNFCESLSDEEKEYCS